MKIELTDQDIKHLKQIRNYFGEHDKSLFEHKAYAVLDELIKKTKTCDHDWVFCGTVGDAYCNNCKKWQEID